MHVLQPQGYQLMYALQAVKKRDSIVRLKIYFATYETRRTDSRFSEIPLVLTKKKTCKILF